MACSNSIRFQTNRRRGFTLLESLMAAGLLFTVVVTVTSAIYAGQQNAQEAKQRISATLAVEELLGRILLESYADLSTWNGYSESAGDMTDMNGQALPAAFAGVGRDVVVDTTLITATGPNVRVRGKNISVRAFNAEGDVLIELNRFVAEPAELSLPVEEEEENEGPLGGLGDLLGL